MFIEGTRGFLAVMNRALALQESPLGEEITGGMFVDPQVVLGTLEEIQAWRGSIDLLFAFDK